MPRNLTVTLTDQHANSVILSDYIEEIDGLGTPPVRRDYRRGPGQHGATERLAHLEPRVITMRLGLGSYWATSSWTKRYSIAKFLSDLDNDLYLDCARLAGNTYRLKVRYYGHMPAPMSPSQIVDRMVLQLIADEPAFYINTQHTETYDYSGGWAWDHTPLVYGGTWREDPIIEITGPCTDCILTNTTIDRKISFLNHTIANGEVVTVNLAYDQKSVSSTGSTDMGDLWSTSDLLDFHLAAYTEADNSENTFTVGWSGTNTATSKVVIKYYKRFLFVY